MYTLPATDTDLLMYIIISLYIHHAGISIVYKPNQATTNFICQVSSD